MVSVYIALKRRSCASLLWKCSVCSLTLKFVLANLSMSFLKLNFTIHELSMSDLPGIQSSARRMFDEKRNTIADHADVGGPRHRQLIP